MAAAAKRLAGKVALVTGGTSGIGRATVELFAAEGAAVVFTGRDETKARAVAEAAGGAASFLRADVRDPHDCERAVAGAVERHGGLDVLFNNAGVVRLATAEATSDETWRTTLDTNVTGTFQMCRAALGALRARGGGAIVNNASDWGIAGGQGAVAYCASKGAVVLMTKALALDHARERIRVNAVCPGDTFVERWREGGYGREPGGAGEPDLDAMGGAIPMGRVAQASEIAEAVLFLASGASGYMTGQCLVVDGGNTAAGASARY